MSEIVAAIARNFKCGHRIESTIVVKRAFHWWWTQSLANWSQRQIPCFPRNTGKNYDKQGQTAFHAQANPMRYNNLRNKIPTL